MNDERGGRRMSSDSPHVDDDTLERFAAGEVGAAERALVRAHADSCPSCAALLRGIALVQSGAREFDPGAPPAIPERSPWTWGTIAVAAALALAVLVPMLTSRLLAPSEPSSITRGTAGDGPVLVAPAGQITAAPARFEWRPSKAAVSYELLLLREDGTMLWQQRVTATFAEPPPGLQLPPARYYWRVRALSDENTAAESSLTTFEIKKP